MNDYEDETWGDLAAREAEEDDARFEEAYGSECVCCGQNIHTHDDKICNESNA
jgi:hypothetical protein